MKKSWQLPLGPWPNHSPKNPKQLLDHLLLPFYLALLAISQLGDVIVFLGLRLSDAIVTALQTLHLSHLSQQQLRLGLSWIITGGLCLLVTMNLAGLFYDLGKRENLNRQQQAPSPTTTHTFTEEIFTMPADIQFATNAATIRFSESEIFNLTQQALNLNNSDRDSVSQAEALNYALAYYYLGNAQQYQLWLEQGRQLDPNSNFFTP